MTLFLSHIFLALVVWAVSSHSAELRARRRCERELLDRRLDAAHDEVLARPGTQRALLALAQAVAAKSLTTQDLSRCLHGLGLDAPVLPVPELPPPPREELHQEGPFR